MLFKILSKVVIDTSEFSATVKSYEALALTE